MNLAAASVGSMRPAGVVDMWFGERAKYDFARGTFSMGSGHFTQVVWKGSRHLGCGTAVCGQMQLWVCNSDPPGNMLGAFQSNVAPTTCRK